jgi:predicted NBD/HSP70 family sugar kinase
VFDVGGTKTRFALVENGVLGQIHQLPTDTSTAGFSRMLQHMHELLGGARLHAVAGGLAGQLEGQPGRLILAANIPHWLGIPVLERMEKVFRCPIYIENDVVMGGLGESHHGLGSKTGVMAYFTVSTGVNGVRLVNGEVDGSISRFEIGHQVIAGVDGRVLSLEYLTGGASFEARRGRSPREVRDRAVWAVEERNLALGMYNTILFWSPDVIVFNGSMMRDIDLQGVQRELDKMSLVMPKWPQLEYSKLGDTAGIYGSLATLAKKRGVRASKTSVRTG